MHRKIYFIIKDTNAEELMMQALAEQGNVTELKTCSNLREVYVSGSDGGVVLVPGALFTLIESIVYDMREDSIGEIAVVYDGNIISHEMAMHARRARLVSLTDALSFLKPNTSVEGGASV